MVSHKNRKKKKKHHESILITDNIIKNISMTDHLRNDYFTHAHPAAK